MPPQRLGHRLLRALRLQVEVDAHARRAQQLEHVVEGRQSVCRGGAVVRDDERLAERVDVELDQVAAELDREPDRLERVLGSERGRAAMADPQRPAVAPRELDHVRLRTTTAQSSASSPPKARQSSTSATASSSAGSEACLRERGVEPLLAVQLALAAGLEQAVREEHRGIARLQRHALGLVRLAAFDPEREPAQAQRLARRRRARSGASGWPALAQASSPAPPSAVT